jgi:hypothetical protein
MPANVVINPLAPRQLSLHLRIFREKAKKNLHFGGQNRQFAAVFKNLLAPESESAKRKHDLWFDQA